MKQRERTARINDLIPTAERNANRMVRAGGREFEMRVGYGVSPRGGIENAEFKWDFFTEYFHSEMSRLTRKYGLRNI